MAKPEKRVTVELMDGDTMKPRATQRCRESQAEAVRETMKVSIPRGSSDWVRVR